MNVYMGAMMGAAAAATDPGAELSGLQLADTHIDDLIDGIDKQLEDYRPRTFEVLGEIDNSSFGGNGRASVLALHHTKAHRVMYETLVGVRADLENFRDACNAAREYLKGVDGEAAENLTAAWNAVNELDYGSWADNGDTAYNDARNNPHSEDI